MHEQRSSTEWTNCWRTKKSKSRELCARVPLSNKTTSLSPKKILVANFKSTLYLAYLQVWVLGYTRCGDIRSLSRPLPVGPISLPHSSLRPAELRLPAVCIHNQSRKGQDCEWCTTANCLGLWHFLICSTCSMHQDSPCLASETQPCLDQNGTQFRQGEVEQYWQ